MRKYMVFYLDIKGKEVSIAINALSGWAAKFIAVHTHSISREKITRVV